LRGLLTVTIPNFFDACQSRAPRPPTLFSAGASLRLSNGVTLSGKFDGEFAGRAQTYAAENLKQTESLFAENHEPFFNSIGQKRK